MPRKNREEYNEYMRNVMRNKYRQKNNLPILDNDFDGTNKPVIDLNSASGLVKQTRELLSTKQNANEVEDDPILKAIDKYGKYLPLVMQFIQGLQGSIQVQNKPQVPQIQAPEGWLGMSPMQKLNRKYTMPEWYSAGERYDEAVQTGQFNPQINTAYVDPNYSSEPKNLTQLARKYPDAPIVDSPPVTQAPKEAPVQKVEEKPKESVETQIISELQADNLRYITMGATFINNLTDDQFKVHLDNIDALVEKAKPFIPLIPVHVKGMLVNTPKEDLVVLFKDKCPTKYAIIENEKKLEKLTSLFESLKTIL